MKHNLNPHVAIIRACCGDSCCIMTDSEPRALSFLTQRSSVQRNPPSRFVFCFETT